MSHCSFITKCFQIYWRHGQQEEWNACRCRSTAVDWNILAVRETSWAVMLAWQERRSWEPGIWKAFPELMAFLGALNDEELGMCCLYSVNQNVICDFRRTWDEATWDPHKWEEDRRMVELAWGNTAILRWNWKFQSPCFPLWFLLLYFCPWCLLSLCLLCPSPENGRSSL